ncbi:MAG: hypothetical protein IKB86_08105 [Clostridia bacterium]|nr:hypothetical protein [Clostridia bacterium]
MKKILAISLALVMAFAFSACSGNNTPADNDLGTPTAEAGNSDSTQNTDATPTAQATPDADASPTVQATQNATSTPTAKPTAAPTPTPTVAPTPTPKPTPSALNPKTDLQLSVEYMGNFRLEGEELHASALQFEGDGCMVTDRMFTLENTESITVEYKGKTYYSLGGGFTPYRYKLTDTEVIITTVYYQDDTDIPSIKATLLGDGTLKVTYSTIDTYPVGLILSTNISDVID